MPLDRVEVKSLVDQITLTAEIKAAYDESVKSSTSRAVIKTTEFNVGAEIGATKSNDGDEQYSTHGVEIKATECIVVLSDQQNNGTSVIKSAEDVPNEHYKAIKSAAESHDQSVQFGSFDIRFKKRERKSQVISSPSLKSRSQFKVYLLSNAYVISLFDSIRFLACLSLRR